MDDDYGKEHCGVVVPVSLIIALTDSLLTQIDKWHEDRGIEDLNIQKCVVAMMAAVDAAVEAIDGYPDGPTLQ